MVIYYIKNTIMNTNFDIRTHCVVRRCSVKKKFKLHTAKRSNVKRSDILRLKEFKPKRYESRLIWMKQSAMMLVVTLSQIKLQNFLKESEFSLDVVS